jgi:inorganic pyrophosphatase
MSLEDLPAEPRPHRYTAVIETPKGSRNKFAYVADIGAFRLGKQLPAGAVFPFDFGFIPSTRADDGDPLDVVVLLDAPTFPGCTVRIRLIGLIDATQTGRSGRQVSNPRLVAVATKSVEHHAIKRLRDLPPVVVDELVHFFVSYNEASGKRFEPTARGGRKRARSLVRASSTAPKDHRLIDRRSAHRGACKATAMP